VFVTNHVLAGTIIGATCRRNAGLAFALGVASHVAMDLTPHWGEKKPDPDRYLRVARRDGLLGLGAMTAVLIAGVPPRRALLAGMLGAAVLDADKPGKHFFGRSPFPPFVDAFHSAIQRERPDLAPRELAYGAVLAAGAVAALIGQRRRAPSRGGLPAG
jgi:hypothetical protein